MGRAAREIIDDITIELHEEHGMQMTLDFEKFISELIEIWKCDIYGYKYEVLSSSRKRKRVSSI